MSKISEPDRMIPVEDYASRKGITPEKVIEQIRKGTLVGQVSGNQWFVDPVTRPATIGNATSQASSGGSYNSDYGAARKVSMFISFLGWLVFAIGLIAAIGGIAAGGNSRYGNEMSLIAMFPGIGIAVSGLFLVAGGQVTRATVDNADHTREILNLLKDRA
jgi:hypothetical protein